MLHADLDCDGKRPPDKHHDDIIEDDNKAAFALLRQPDLIDGANWRGGDTGRYKRADHLIAIPRFRLDIRRLEAGRDCDGVANGGNLAIAARIYSEASTKQEEADT